MLFQSSLTLCAVLAPTHLIPGLDDHGRTDEALS